MRAASFFWHDYETFGTDSRRDRPSQFAGIRTTLGLEPIGEPVSFYCKPAPDVLPRPFSCLITGITPRRAERDGVSEAEFAGRVHDELSMPGTCGVGFNSIRFDDEFTRNLLYRNFYDPYEREWKDANSRWDIIDLARMAFALRPEGVEWPRREDGTPSFRLEDLAAANGLTHLHAHDALSDVQATLGLARLIKHRQPKLWDFYFGLRQKQRVLDLLDWTHLNPVLHISSRYAADRGCVAMVVPLTVHPDQQNKVIVYDLDTDPAPLIDLDPEDIADRVFTSRDALPDDVERIPLKAVSINKSPALAPMSVLRESDLARIRIDRERCERHLDKLRQARNVAEKCRRVFATQRSGQEQLDPELAIYSGFACDADRKGFPRVRSTPPHQLGTTDFGFKDWRCAELLFRYRARNHPDSLTHDERERWDAFRRARLTESTPLTTLTLDQFFVEIAQSRLDPAPFANKSEILDELDNWGRELARELAPETLA
jgi:exodeoxyribonuclease-1